MKKILLSTVMGAAIMMTVSNVRAQNPTSSGSLTVTATIDPSISLSFATDGSGLTLSSGAGTNAATLAFGDIAAYGLTPPTNVTRTVNGAAGLATAFSVSTPFDVLVMQANSSSTGYTLTAALNTADTTNAWSVGGTSVTSSATQLTASGTYDSAASYTLLISIPFTNTTGSLSNAINFVATAN